jgi:regulator of cell morphogenesis and NO signaling
MGILQQTVGEIAARNPRSVRVFEELGIDYCCGGNRTLADACAQACVPTERALELIEKTGQSINPPPAAGPEGWNFAPLRALTGHIVREHHGYVRTEAPRLEGLFRKVLPRHGEAHPELKELEELFVAMVGELGTHMMKEEQILFPHLERMEAARQAGAAAPQAVFGPVSRPIANMVADHDDAGALLARMRALSGGYTLPQDACPSYTVLYSGLQDFERDLHRHVHLENNILFPRAIDLERQFTETP